MDAGVAAVIGAAIGTIGGLSGGVLTAVSQGGQQRRQRQIDRERRLEEVRRDAYTAYINSSKQVSAAWWRLNDRLCEKDGSAERQQEAAEEAFAMWAPFSAAAAAVTVSGPGYVADAADVLRQAMYELDMAGMAWHEAVRQGGDIDLKVFGDRFNEAAEAKRAPANAFQAAARKALGAET